MSSKQSKNALKAAIITMSFVQMGTNGVAPILEEIGKAFPEASATKVQFLMTFPSIFMVIFALAAALMANKLPQKKLALGGLALVTAGGIGACLIHGSINILFAWAAVIGIGIGMVMPIAPALVNKCFDGGERQTMLGIQNSSANIGSMLMTFFGGFLAAAGWHFGYLVYLVAVPGIFCTLIGVKEEKDTAAVNETKKAPFKIRIWKEMLTGFCFLMLFSAIPANLAMLVSEKSIGSTALAGTMSTIFLLGGMIAGFAFGFIVSKLKWLTPAIGALLLASGALVSSLAPNAIVLAIACFLGGASISLIMPGCMGGVSKMPGYETLGVALILSFANLGVFIAPLLTTLTKLVRGSEATMYRFQTIACVALLLAVVLFFAEKKQK